MKWAGSKRSVLPELVPHFPQPGAVRTYFEPFLGGGSVALHVLHQIRPERAVLSDRNPALIEAYEVVRDRVDELIDRLEAHHAAHGADHYYAVRAEQPQTREARAARLIYLNKTCFNGLYRLNKKGAFNVPIGRIRRPLIVDPPALRRVSALLQTAELRSAPFDEVLDDAGEGDFLYLDPPYDPVSDTANFTAYDGLAFGREDQARLASYTRDAATRGAAVVASNSDTAFVRSLYLGFEVHTVTVLRKINRAIQKRGPVVELVFVAPGTSPAPPPTPPPTRP